MEDWSPAYMGDLSLTLIKYNFELIQTTGWTDIRTPDYAMTSPSLN